MEDIPVITIDGLSGSGKGTISKMLCLELGWNILDSGALYRTLAYLIDQRAIVIEDFEINRKEIQEDFLGHFWNRLIRRTSEYLSKRSRYY